MEQKNIYEYCKRGKVWAVYSPEGTKVDSFIDREDARKKVYELNGWKYKPNKN